MNDEHEYSLDDADDSASAMPADESADALLDELLLRFGKDYNAPPDIVPREAMWRVIRQQQPVRHIAVSRFAGSRLVWGALAATLLLGVGIGIGVEARPRGSGQIGGATQATPRVAATTNSDSEAQLGTSTPDVRNVQPPSAAVADARDSDPRRSVSGFSPSARSTAYTLASARHFAAVEALLTSFESSGRDARDDAQMASWARALLSQTRLLLDSPAAANPPRKQLLQDLELILVQMTQLSPADARIDREMINGSVRHADVLDRLRTAVPAGATHL